MANNIWRHRAIAAAMGITALLAVTGAGAVITRRSNAEAAEMRAKAKQRLVAYYHSQGDSNSAKVSEGIFERRSAVASRGWQAEDFDFFLSISSKPVDQVVICQALGVLISQEKQGNLDEKQTERLVATARGLFTHKDWLVRCYGLNLCGKLGDRSAKARVSNLSQSDENQSVREQAAKTLLLLD